MLKTQKETYANIITYTYNMASLGKAFICRAWHTMRTLALCDVDECPKVQQPKFVNSNTHTCTFTHKNLCVFFFSRFQYHHHIKRQFGIRCYCPFINRVEWNITMLRWLTFATELFKWKPMGYCVLREHWTHNNRTPKIQQKKDKFSL